MPSVSLLIVGAGDGTRLPGEVRKPYQPIGGQPILFRTLERFRDLPEVRQSVLVVHPDDVERVQETYADELAAHGVSRVLAGGTRRQDSVAAGLREVAATCDLVAIHDAVRPFVARESIQEAFRKAGEVGAAIVAAPIVATIKRVAGDSIAETVPREGLWQAQTPQVFERRLILRAYEQAAADGFEGTDDAQFVERIGHPVAIVEGDGANLKITTPADLELARKLVQAGTMMRVGLGHDVHRLVPDRPLVLGGLKLEHDRGLLGHSDADVVLHAVCDALLGAAALGDIGDHFPDTDPQWKGADSSALTKSVLEKVRSRGFAIVNVDVIVFAEEPKLGPLKRQIAENVAGILQLEPGAVNVKAKTAEGLGLLGNGEAIAAQAVAALTGASA